LMPDAEFFLRVSKLGEMDLQQLRTTMRSLISVFFGMQSSRHVIGQRMIPGHPFRVWSRSDMMLRCLAAVADGSFQGAVTKGARCRLALLRLATELRVLHRFHAHEALNKHSKGSSRLRPNFSTSSVEATVLGHSQDAGNLSADVAHGLPLEQKVTCEEFSTLMGRHTSLAESEIKLAYECITCNSISTPTLLSIMETLIAEAPYLDPEQQACLQDLQLHSADAEDSSSRVRSGDENISSL